MTDKEQIQKVIDAHKFLVGFNNEAYDNPILVREGMILKYKRIIDLRKIFKMRASQMKTKEGMLGELIMSYSLDYITKLLGISEEGKMEIDYKLFEKDTWTPEETKLIMKYTNKDIEITKKLYEWVEAYFQPFKLFLTEEDNRNKVYLTKSLAGLAYKAICKELNWEEQYGESIQNDERITGGYVSYPAGEKFEGTIYALDFNSLYPHIMLQCNLYGRKKEQLTGIQDERKTWNGNDKWKVEGIYYKDKLSRVGELLKKWYADRVKYKQENDRREYTVKIFINIIYGILNNPYYHKVYDRIAGGDCTRLGRQWTKYARKKFKEAGYNVIYNDTDSCYVLDHLKDKKRLIEVKDQIINDIKESVPFPQDTFDMGIDDEIKYIFFFKGGSKDNESEEVLDEDDKKNKKQGFMKKNYIYVTKDDRVVIKNLGIKKKNNSLLSRKIFWDYLVPEIRKGQVKFNKTFIKNLIIKLLEHDVSLASMRKEVGNIKQYKSPTCLAAQISQKYGGGIHFLIPNKRGIGVGKGKQFCTYEEFKEYNLKIDDIDLSNIWKELHYFIEPVQTKNIFEYVA